MIIVKINSGLGNQMFQYAAGKQLAIRNNTQLKLDVSFYQNQNLRKFELKIFPLKADVISTAELDNYIPITSPGLLRNTWRKIKRRLYGYTILVEKQFNFQPEITTAGKNIYLSGYWQSEKYFKSVEKTIREEFKFVQKLNEVNSNRLDKITGSNSVSIHIRRGDYVTNKDTNAHHGTCSMDYYNSAVVTIASKVNNPVFFIFSDDIKWVKENFNIPFEHYYIEGNEGSSHEDMHLMAACKHNIIANSSFSWWAAWLNANQNKIVIAPEKWFNQSNRDTTDLLPESWIKI